MQKEILKNFNREVKSFYCAFLSLSDVTSFILMMMMIRTCAILHIRIAKRLVMGSCCRGGIVNIRGGCSRALERMASSSQGALAVSCKYFKQSKWPFLAAYAHAHSSNLSYLRSTRYSSI